MERFTKAALAKELIDAHPNAAKRALARRLHKEHPEVFRDIEQARTTVRQVCGAHGAEHREKMKTRSEKPHGKAGWKPAIPPSLAETWAPVPIDGPCKILVLSDTHVPYHSEEAIRASVAYAKRRFKPDVLLLNGDICDFFSVSRYEKSPKKRDLATEIDLTEALLEWLAEQFPKARKIYREGNHETRWDHWCWNHAEAAWGLEGMRLKDILHMADYGYEFVGDQRPIMAGKLAVFHGHELGRGGLASPVNPARGAFMRTLSSVLVGHHHRTSTHAESDMWHSETVTWSTGCLCNLRPEYNPVSNKWNHGCAVIEVHEDNSYDVHNFRLSDDFKVRAS